jgi:UDP-N-acetylglucosamine 2-epimerase (non-hydrolysing)
VKILSVVGARPQFVKLAPVAEAFAGLAGEGWQHVIVHTGQHYDHGMSEAFFADLHIPQPDVNLGIGSGGHGAQTGQMLIALDAVLDEHRPDWVLVYGDTNSTLAGTLSAVKLHLRVAHLEAGLRSFNRRMPEEHNRVLTDHAADLLLAPTRTAVEHLRREGLADRTELVGDVMTDVCLRVRDAVLGDPTSVVDVVPASIADDFVLATIHRAETTDDPHRLAAVVRALQELEVPVLLLAHPRLLARAATQGLELSRGSLHVGPPAPYPALVSAVLRSRGVVTDSGGLQKEAFLLGRPCTTLRAETEWVETLDGGWNMLAPDPGAMKAAVGRPVPQAVRATPYGDGHAAEAVTRALRVAGA